MNDEQIRITALTEMFLGLGHEPTPERIAYYARLLKNVPIEYIRVACDHAVAESTSGFPPSPGEIIKQAERLYREHERKRFKESAAARWIQHVEGLSTPQAESDEIGRIIEESLKN